MKGTHILNWIAFVILVIGGLNWGLIGIFNYDLVRTIFGIGMLANVVYSIVGISAIYLLIMSIATKLRLR